MTHGAVSTENHVVILKRGTDTHGHGFLSLILMERSRHEPLQKQAVKVVFEATDQDHPPEHFNKRCARGNVYRGRGGRI